MCRAGVVDSSGRRARDAVWGRGVQVRKEDGGARAVGADGDEKRETGGVVLRGGGGA